MLDIKPETFETDNWAELLDEAERSRLATELKSEIQIDEASRSEWMTSSEQWTDLAMQVSDIKSFPWQNASNVKYPLLTTASMQFHSRAQQALLKGNKPIKAKILGEDPTGEKTQKAERLQDFMGYLLKHHIEDWEDEIDRMLMVLPIIGMAFKKVYYSESLGRARSELILPSDLILNYHATDFARARKTHTMRRYHNEVVELQRAGFFLNVDLQKPAEEGGEELSPQEREIWECHCFLDLDDDGYDEPYVIILDNLTEQILRIAPRFSIDDIAYNDSGEIVKIEPIEFFVRFVFLPSVESKLYGVGLGTLLGPTNTAVNTLINQLIDAGTLSVLPSGFLGRGSRIARGGSYKFAPGEWKHIQSTGDDLRKNIFPLPVKEPSMVLYQLLGTLIESGQQIGSVADIMLGENPGQNQPFSTTQAVLEQGMKVFVGIYKRIYRSMSFEYKQLLRIMSEIDQQGSLYSRFFDQQGISLATDYSPGELDVVPVSDPDMVSESQRLIKAESLLQKVAMGMPLNVQEVLKRTLEAEDHENIEALMNVPPPRPDPEVMLKAMEIQANTMVEMAKLEKEVPESQMGMFKDYAQAMVNLAKAQATADSTELQAQRDMADAYIARTKIDADKEAKENAAAAGATASKTTAKAGGSSSGSS